MKKHSAVYLSFPFIVAVLIACLGLRADEYWQLYSQRETDQMKKFQEALAADAELKTVYEQYQAAVRNCGRLIAENNEYAALDRQLKEAKDVQKRLYDADSGGPELSRQNDYISTLERRMAECLGNIPELKVQQDIQTQSRRKLLELLDKHEIRLYSLRPTLKDFFDLDGELESECLASQGYELDGDNPFKDAFKDLSKALFSHDVNKAARKEVTEALCKDFPDSSVKTIEQCMGYFYDFGSTVLPKEAVSTEAKKDVFEEYLRLMCWQRQLKTDDKEGIKAFQKAIQKFQSDLPYGSLLRFIVAYQLRGTEDSHSWYGDFNQWVIQHPEQVNLLKYFNELLSYSHAWYKNDSLPQMVQIMQTLEPYEDQLSDLWLLHVARSIDAWRRAWKSRGGGWASSVSQKGWDGYGEARKEALKEARAAVALHPDWAGGYICLLNDFESDHREDFLQLLKYRPDFSEAYVLYSWSLMPRWGGSHALIAALARTCMETRRYDTALPSIGLSLLGSVAWDTAPWSRWNAVYQQAWIEPIAKELFAYRQTQKDWLRRDFRLDQALFFMALRRYDEAEKLVQAVEADYPKWKRSFPSWNGRNIGNWYPKIPAWEDAVTHLALFTGPYAAELREIEELAEKGGKSQEAADRLSEFLKSHAELKIEERDFLTDLRARWRMPECDASCYAENQGWGLAINYALKNGHKDVFKELLDGGFDFKKFEHYPGEMAVYLAENGTLPEMLDALKRIGDPLNRPSCTPELMGEQPIHVAARYSNIPMMKRLLELGISPDARNNHNHAPLHFCAQHGSAEGIRVLLSAGANPDVQDADGDTPLMFIPQVQKSPECLQLLAQASKNINCANNGCMTALHYAAQNGDSPEYIQILLAAGADPQARNAGGQTPYHLAKGRYRDDLAALLPPPSPEGGMVYHSDGTVTPWKPGSASSDSTLSHDDWTLVFKEIACMPEAWGILVFILAGVAWFLIHQRRK